MTVVNSAYARSDPRCRCQDGTHWYHDCRSLKYPSHEDQVGSCNRETGHIWFNVELAKKHPTSLEYIAVHEMTHLLERGHGDRFTKLMDRFMPDWRTRRDLLNQSPLAHEDWDH